MIIISLNDETVLLNVHACFYAFFSLELEKKVFSGQVTPLFTQEINYDHKFRV